MNENYKQSCNYEEVYRVGAPLGVELKLNMYVFNYLGNSLIKLQATSDIWHESILPVDVPV